MDTSKQNISATENNFNINTINSDITTTTVESEIKTNAQNLWKEHDEIHQVYATISSADSITKSDETFHMYQKVDFNDLEKRKEVYGICGECNEPGTGIKWCQPCNAKRFEENFKNWTSGNKNIDELIQQSQLDAFFCTKLLEWIPFENFENVTYFTRGGFSKIYLADWPEGHIMSWDIKNQKWERIPMGEDDKVALKSLDNLSNISVNFLNEIKYHNIHFHCINVIPCYGITQDPNTKDYMMVSPYCDGGSLRDVLKYNLSYEFKMDLLFFIIDGLLAIHNAGKVHKDFHSGNILISNSIALISDLGMCQPVNNEGESVNKEGIYGVLPYMAPEVLRGFQYTKAADLYSFGIIMNEIMSEEIPYNDIPHDYILAIKICKGFRPKISKNTPKLIADLIIKCWDAKAENRPTAKDLCQIFYECFDDERRNLKSRYYTRIKNKLREIKLKNKSNENKLTNLQMHPQAIYTSRLLNFKKLPEPINSTESSSFQEADISPTLLANPISECLDCELKELDLK